MRFERNFHIRHRRVVLCKAHIIKTELLCLKSGEVRVDKGSGDFSCSVRAEVKEDNGVAAVYCTVFVYNERNNKFVGFAVFIAFLEIRANIGMYFTYTVYHCVIGKFHSVIIAVSVHCVVSAGHGADFAYAGFGYFVFKLCNKACAACRGDISAVHESVYRDIFGTQVFAKVK